MWLLRNWFAMAWWRGGRGRRMGGQVYRARGRSYEEREYEHGKGKLSSFFAVAWSVQSFSLIYRGNQSPTWMTPIERSLLHTSLLSFKFRKVMSRLPVRPIRFVPLGTARFWESLGAKVERRIETFSLRIAPLLWHSPGIYTNRDFSEIVVHSSNVGKCVLLFSRVCGIRISLSLSLISCFIFS